MVRVLCCLLLLSSSLFSHPQGIPRGIPRGIPSTVQEIEALVDQAINELETNLETFANEETKSPKSLVFWNKMAQNYFVSGCILHNLNTLFADKNLAAAGEKGLYQLHCHLMSVLKEKRVLLPLILSLEKALSEKRLSPSENYLLQSFSTSLEYLPISLQRRVICAQRKSLFVPQLTYTQLEGSVRESSSKNQITLLSWNTCLLPSPISLIFGGVLPWELRKARLLQFLKEQGADILCLQEVFDAEATQFLYEGLKGEYSHFYTDIGPKTLGVNPTSMGLNSGLFVATKFPIENMHWEKFASGGLPVIERGFFSFDISNYHIITTHLEPSLTTLNGAGKEDRCRLEQMQQLLKWIDSKKSPTLLIGDLNIYRGSSEPAELLLEEHFTHLCPQKKTTYCDYTGYIWPEYFLNKNRTTFQAKLRTLDYALIRNASPPQFSAEVVPVHTPQSPLDALSDHHAILIKINYNSN